MKRSYLRMLIVFIILTTFFSLNNLPVFATDYITTQITNNNYQDRPPQINENGVVVWSGGNAGDQEIFIFDGTTTQLTFTPASQKHPQINNSGHVVWLGFDRNEDSYEVFLYDGYTIKQLTDNSVTEQHPQINDNGQVVWFASDGNDNEIFLYEGGVVKQITDNTYTDQYPQINNRGEIVWAANSEPGWGIFLYDYSGTIRKISTSPNIFSSGLYINNNGEVVWTRLDGPAQSLDSEIMYYDGETEIQLTNNSFHDGSPQINDNGFIVWEGEPDGSNSAIYLYDGSSINQILYYDDYHVEKLQINNNEEVVWYAHFDGGSGWEIYLYDGTDVTQLTNNDYTDADPQMNDNGDIVWYGGTTDGSTWEIYYASPVPEPPTPALVGYWKFDEDSEGTAYDSSAYGNDGAIEGATPAAGKCGSALYFDAGLVGGVDYVVVPNSDSINTSTFTVSFWVSISDLDQTMVFLHKRNTQWGRNFQISYNTVGPNGEPKDYLRVKIDNGTRSNDFDNAAFAEVNLENDRYYNVVGTYDQDKLKLYLDGIKIAEHSITMTDNVGDGDLYIGTHSAEHLTMNPTNGIIDEVRIYNYALTQEQIQADMEACLPETYTVSVDIKPGKCPNRVNIEKRPFFTAAILGTEDFDVTDINLESVRLVYTVEEWTREVAPIRSRIRDKSRPPIEPAEECDCTTEGPDERDDLLLKFDTEEVVNELDVPMWETIELKIMGELNDGTPFEGADCILFKEGKRPK